MNLNKVHPWQEIANEEQLKVGHGMAIWTLVMPIFNQEKIIKNVLNAILDSATLPFDIILIDDASEDSTVSRLREFVNDSISCELVRNITLLVNSCPIYETACDNLGFKLTQTEYVIEIQSDIYVRHKGFDARMIDAMRKFDLSAVSGRHVHNLSLLDGRRSWLKYPIDKLWWSLNGGVKAQGVGRLGKLIFDRPKKIENICYVGETVARGPWLHKVENLKRLNFLDEVNFFLGNDDHDFHIRALNEMGKLPGYVPIDIQSIEAEGSTRKERSGLNLKIYKYLVEKKVGSESFHSFMRSYKPFHRIQKFQL